ncbi:peptidylprolyl isomerase [Muriicola soli]|nr:peptidylprolyl isomerase [Muriicola soli]
MLQKYLVFGEVVEGMGVIHSIAKVNTDDMNRPLEDFRILSLKVVE